MTGPEAYDKAVEYAAKAEEHANHAFLGANLAGIAQAYAAIAQAEATARRRAQPGYLPGGGWDRITDPDPYAV